MSAIFSGKKQDGKIGEKHAKTGKILTIFKKEGYTTNCNVTISKQKGPE